MIKKYTNIFTLVVFTMAFSGNILAATTVGIINKEILHNKKNALSFLSAA